MIQIIISMASITHVQHLFSMKHIFLEENTASLSIQKKEGRKNWIRTIILATQNSFHKSNVFNWLSYENILFPFKYTLLLFSRFYFLGANIKGTIFSGRVRSHPLHSPQLRAWIPSYQTHKFYSKSIWLFNKYHGPINQN